MPWISLLTVPGFYRETFQQSHHQVFLMARAFGPTCASIR